MRIGIVTAWFDGGAGYVSRALEETLSRDHDVFIFARGGIRASRDPFWNRPNVTWGRLHPCLTGIHTRQFGGWARKYRLDAVIFNEQRHWKAVLEARNLGMLAGAYVDYYTQDTVPLFRLYDFLICNTKRHYSVFADHPQALYVPWGTDCETFHPQPNSNRPVTFFLSAGLRGTNDRKGTGPTLSAFSKVSGNTRLIVHSQLPLKQFPQAWQQIVQADSRIEFRVGTVKPPGLFHLGDVYVYPSRLEGIGLSLVEAVACGLPAIIPDWPPMNEFVTRETGSLISVSRVIGRQDGYYWPEVEIDLEALAKSMQDYVDAPEKVARQSTAARRFALARLDWSRNSRDLPKLLANCRRLKLDADTFGRLAALSARSDLDANPTLRQQWLRVHWRIAQFAFQQLRSVIGREARL